jgi:serine/threonine protein kinase
MGQTTEEELAVTGRTSRVPPARGVELMLPVVHAPAYAHEQGIVHRDLEPEKVIFDEPAVMSREAGVPGRIPLPRIDLPATPATVLPCSRGARGCVRRHANQLAKIRGSR